jgi:hypothetical protein
LATEADDFLPNFKVNFNLLNNAFKSGIRYQKDVDMSTVTMFPYEVDNVPKIVDSFTLSKVFDNMARRFRSPSDQEFVDQDIRVNYPFTIRQVVHNSALNADFINAMKAKNANLLYPFCTDYELNYRQFAIYMVDCI